MIALRLRQLAGFVAVAILAGLFFFRIFLSVSPADCVLDCGAVRSRHAAAGAATIAGRTVWITGYATAGIVDRSSVNPTGLFTAGGTKTYSNAAGSSNTVHLIRPATADEAKQANAERGVVDERNARSQAKYDQAVKDLEAKRAANRAKK